MKTREKFTHEDFTARSYPLPHPDNIAAEDAMRIREAIITLDQEITTLENKSTSLDKTLERIKLENLLNLWR